MSTKIPVPAEAFPTVKTLVGLLSPVDSLVVDQIRALREAFPALNADVGLLSCAGLPGGGSAFALAPKMGRFVHSLLCKTLQLPSSLTLEGPP